MSRRRLANESFSIHVAKEEGSAGMAATVGGCPPGCQTRSGDGFRDARRGQGIVGIDAAEEADDDQYAAATVGVGGERERAALGGACARRGLRKPE